MIIENYDTYGLDDCLITPVAAKSIKSIEQFVGNIIRKSKDDKWCYVDFTPLSPPNNLEVWNHARSYLINQRLQCWVRIDYTGYRNRYKSCFPNVNIDKMVIDHILNRRFAKVFGFNYVRLVHLDKSVNSSSGAGMEYDVINYKNPDGLSKFKESSEEVYYADPSDLIKILNMKVGAFPLDNVRDNSYLFYGKR
ncbi:hypothetical protein AGMMS50268_30180 [Spirochaetia bacterium]|nr:hypothetical protein AGMMS50268_30180 [Spirochaetia bacterium]